MPGPFASASATNSLTDPRIYRRLRCPHCAGGLEPEPADGGALRALVCRRGHRFDAARQGYANFAVGGAAARGDSAEMLAARERFLAAGHFAALADAVAQAAGAAIGDPGRRPRPDGGPSERHGSPGEPLLVEIGSGTGYYLARALDETPGRLGLALDASPAALRRLARAHKRMAAIGVDAWRTWPIADGGVACLLCVFGPRNPAEFARVLAPAGAIVVATPGADHLAELIEPLSMVRVAPDKQERLADQMAGFELASQRAVRAELRLNRAAVGDLVSMGPTARHVSPEQLAERIARLPDPAPVTLDVRVATYRHP